MTPFVSAIVRTTRDSSSGAAFSGDPYSWKEPSHVRREPSRRRSRGYGTAFQMVAPMTSFPCLKSESGRPLACRTNSSQRSSSAAMS